jgi:two-component system OmpR family response regulator
MRHERRLNRTVRSGNRHPRAATVCVVHVLLVERDPAVAVFVRRVLQGEGARVDVTTSGADAVARLRDAQGYDVAIVAGCLPDAPGREVCRELRDGGVWTALLLLSDGPDALARESGADASLRKPFTGAQLLTTLRGFTRQADARDAGRLAAGDLQLDATRGSVTRAGVDVHLSPTEFSLLEILLRRAGEVVDRSRLLDHAWTYDYEDNSNVLQVYLSRLREKVDRPFGTAMLETVRGRGYRLHDPAT